MGVAIIVPAGTHSLTGRSHQAATSSGAAWMARQTLQIKLSLSFTVSICGTWGRCSNTDRLPAKGSTKLPGLPSACQMSGAANVLPPNQGFRQGKGALSIAPFPCTPPLGDMSPDFSSNNAVDMGDSYASTLLSCALLAPLHV